MGGKSKAGKMVRGMVIMEPEDQREWEVKVGGDTC